MYTSVKNKRKKMAELFLAFFKIGAFTFGGGYAMIPLIQKEAVEKNKWISDDDILDIIAIAESTPGPIAINSATFVGYKTAGVLGSLMATLGVVLPSFVIILAISYAFTAFRDLAVVEYAFNGIRAGVLALLVKAVWTMYKKSPKGVFSHLIMGLALVISAFTDINVLYIIVACALAGLIHSLLVLRRNK